MSEPFLFIAGHPALDFLNTEKADDAGERVELLAEPESVAAWLRASGMHPVPADDSLLSDARTLRDAVRSLVVAWTSDTPAPDEPLALLNCILATGAARQQMASDFTGQEIPVIPAPHPLLPLALSALNLLTRHDKTLVRKCAGTGCVLWFLDTTKNKRRRWCRMEACGNREKVSSHYQRHRKLADSA
ncbi:MAG: CGNR zinc finger domain-containing protein [Akkermansiaceae bacterium]|nr:CGNR zinc finger domain-containing protein [Armatimonadota bacterium]